MFGTSLQKNTLANQRVSSKYFKMSKQVSPVFIALLFAAVCMATCLAAGAGAGTGATAAGAGAGKGATAAGGGAGATAGGAGAGAGAGATAAAGEEPILEFYMHDILGGSSPTARPITGILGNIYSGQVPFAKPVGFLPPQNGVAIPNPNGAIPTVNGVNGLPLGTGLAGTAFSGNQNQNGQPQIPLGPDGLSLGFGTITVIDDVLTNSPDLGSQAIGKAQGVYVASSADGTTQMMAFTAMIEGGEYNDNLNFYGVYKIGSTVSLVSVTGGTGRFKNACGLAEVRPLIPSGQHVTDGAETLLRITVHLKY